MSLVKQLGDVVGLLPFGAALIVGGMLVAMGQGMRELARLRALGGLIVVSSVLLFLSHSASSSRLA